MAICLVLTFSAASARAGAVSTSQARVDWASLAISGDITWSDKGSESYAYAEDATDSDEDDQGEPGWVDTSAFASITGSAYHAYGEAYTDEHYLYEEAYARANEDIPRSYSWGYATRYGDFIANSSGWVTFSANYELSQNLGTEYAGEQAYGYAEASIWLVNKTESENDFYIATLENSVSDGNITELGETGTLTVSLLFNAEDYGDFYAEVYNAAEAEASIPEPATICLLGLGVLSLIRKKLA